MADAKDMEPLDTYNIRSFEKKQEKQMAGVKPVPDGYHTATPYLIVSDAAKAITGNIAYVDAGYHVLG